MSAVSHITCFLIAGARCVGVVCAANFRVVVHPAITERHKGSAFAAVCAPHFATGLAPHTSRPASCRRIWVLHVFVILWQGAVAVESAMCCSFCYVGHLILGVNREWGFVQVVASQSSLTAFGCWAGADHVYTRELAMPLFGLCAQGISNAMGWAMCPRN